MVWPMPYLLTTITSTASHLEAVDFLMIQAHWIHSNPVRLIVAEMWQEYCGFATIRLRFLGSNILF
jgi:hypothetical protein